MKRFRVILPALFALAFSLRAEAQRRSWVSLGPTGGQITAIVIDRVHPTVLYAGTGGGGIFKSSDGAATWSLSRKGLSGSIVASLVIDPGVPSILYAGTDAGVFKTTDGAASWTR